MDLPLGVVTDCMRSEGGTVPADGEPDSEGNLTRYTHRLEWTHCIIHADWSGPLVDVVKLRGDAEDDISDAGFDPEDVDVKIASITPAVRTVGLRGKHGATLDRGVSYSGAIFVDGADKLVDIESTAEIADPDITVHESRRLTDIANDAWADGTTVTGSATADVVIRLEELDGDLDDLPKKPRLRVQFTFELEGNASLD